PCERGEGFGAVAVRHGGFHDSGIARAGGGSLEFPRNSKPGGLTVSSSNPAFSRELFPGYEQVYGAPRSMATTVQGTVGKTFLLLAMRSGTGLWAWTATGAGRISPALLGISAIGGFIVAMITIFRPTTAPYTAPLYAALEGVFLGALSQLIESRMGIRYQGI